MKLKQRLPYPFGGEYIPPIPPLFKDDPYMQGWWKGYYLGIDTGRWRAEVDQLTRWQRLRLVRMCLRQLERRERHG